MSAEMEHLKLGGEKGEVQGTVLCRVIGRPACKYEASPVPRPVQNWSGNKTSTRPTAAPFTVNN